MHADKFIMSTEDVLAESFQQIPEKTNVLQISHVGLWEMYQLKKKDNIDKIFSSAPVQQIHWAIMLQPRLLIHQAVVSSLEVARVTIGCQQYIFVVTNDYRFLPSSEMFSGCKHQSHCVCCQELVFHPVCRALSVCLCSESRTSIAVRSAASPHPWVFINASVLPSSRFLSVTTRSKQVICSPDSCCDLLWNTNPAASKLPYK